MLQRAHAQARRQAGLAGWRRAADARSAVPGRADIPPARSVCTHSPGARRQPEPPARRPPAQYAANLSQLASKARSIVRDLDPTNDLTFVRVRTKKNEIMIAPEKDFTLMVIQNPSQE